MKSARRALLFAAITLLCNIVGSEPASATAAGGGMFAGTGTVQGITPTSTSGTYNLSMNGPLAGTLADSCCIPPTIPISCNVTLNASGSFSFPPPNLNANGSGSLSCSAPGVSISCSVSVRVTYPPLCIEVDGQCSYNVNIPPVSASGTFRIQMHGCLIIMPPPSGSTMQVIGRLPVVFSQV